MRLPEGGAAGFFGPGGSGPDPKPDREPAADFTAGFTAGFVGLGLMGGSLAAALGTALRASGTPVTIFAHDRNRETLAEAEARGIIRRGFDSPEEMLRQCRLVFICLNPQDSLAFMDRWMAVFPPGCLITDIAGVKTEICRRMERDLRKDLDFIPGHPMAGSEKWGFENSGNVSFSGKNYILVPLERNRRENLAMLKELVGLMGFGRIVECSPEEHDRKVAFTSQLCHVIAAALIDSQADTKIARFGGGSFEDLTRIAMMNCPMWTELFLANRENLTAEIRSFRSSLDRLETLIARGDGGNLRELLRQTGLRRTEMGNSGA